MKKLMGLIFVLLAAAALATAAFAAGSGNPGFFREDRVCLYAQEDCPRQEDRNCYTDQDGDGVCDHRSQGRRNRFCL